VLACTREEPAAPADPAAKAPEAATQPAAPKAEAKEAEAKETAPKPDAPPPATPAAPAGRAPRVTAVLSAADTMGVMGIEGLAEWGTLVPTIIEALPAEMRADMPPELGDPAKRVEKLGFDPFAPEGWSTIGIDPAAGVALFIDRRLEGEKPELTPRPALAFRVTDRAKLIAFLAGRGKAVTLNDAAGPSEVATVDTERFLVGARGGFAIVQPVPTGVDPATMRPAFDAFLAAKDASLADAEPLGPAVRLLGGPARVFSIGQVGLLAARALSDPAEMALATWVGERLPAIGASFSPGAGELRLLASAEAARDLARVFEPAAEPPRFSRFIGADEVVVRFSLNLTSFFDGIAALIPPAAAQARAQVIMAKNIVPVGTGVTLEEFAQAFTGHFAVVLAATMFGAKNPQPDGVFLIGVSDQTKADDVVKRLLDKIAKQGGASVEPVQVKDHPGYALQAGGPTVMVVRVEDVLVIGPSRARVEAALGGGGAKGEAAAAADGRALFAMAIPRALTAKMMAQVDDGTPQSAAARAALDALWPKFIGDAFDARLVLDDHGVRAVGMESAMIAGVLPAVAIPAFVKYIRRSKAAEARMRVRSIAMAAQLASMDGKLPAAAPLTPEADPCANGDDGQMVTAESFAHPTWQALGFAPEGKLFYRYAFEPTADGKGFTARAVGDLDCDGVASTFEVTGAPDESGELSISPINVTDELE
ncbi:MAG: hypothetical protein KC620_10380, partial [Myxococcales bacterium]|nr:hypothetical protein [Myxococcales bacterium]